MTNESTPKRKRGRIPQWTSEQDALLGQFSDSEIARRLGKVRVTVRHRRMSLGIPTCKGEEGSLINWTPETQALLGTMSDSQLAAQLNLTRVAVCARRHVFGIPCFKLTSVRHSCMAIDAAKIRARREALGLTRSALAEGKVALKVILRRLESGRQTSVRRKTLQRLCALLRCQPKDITSEATDKITADLNAMTPDEARAYLATQGVGTVTLAEMMAGQAKPED